VGDIEGDGNVEILVGTGLGVLYLLEGKTGKVRDDDQFPISMDSIHGRVAMHDVDGNGKLDIIANDINGNLAVFDHQGKELWSAQFTPSSHVVRELFIYSLFLLLFLLLIIQLICLSWIYSFIHFFIFIDLFSYFILNSFIRVRRWATLTVIAKSISCWPPSSDMCGPGTSQPVTCRAGSNTY